MSLESKAKTVWQLKTIFECKLEKLPTESHRWNPKAPVILDYIAYMIAKWVPLEEAQKLEAENKYLQKLNDGLEKIAFENAVKVDKSNKILDETPINTPFGIVRKRLRSVLNE